MGIDTVWDLLNHYPRRYEDFSTNSSVASAQPGEILTIRAKIVQIKNEYTRNRKIIQRAIVADTTGSMEILWFNQPFLARNIKAGEEYNFSGKVELSRRKILMISPDYEKIDSKRFQTLGTIHTGRLVSIYPETYGVSSKWLRSRIAPILNDSLDQLLEHLPDKIIERERLLSYAEAILKIHFPETKDQAELARKRLAFDELFLIQLASLKRKGEWQREVVGHKFQISNFKSQISNFIKSLPFSLTGAQNKAIDEILNDLEKNQPMNRLLEGDVGSGKTVVAAVAMYIANLNNYQSIIMAPTEILAVQHFNTLKNLFQPFGVKIGLITHSHQLPAKSQQLPIIVGTHALLSEKNKKVFQNVGLVVIDEQHRFGVEQRAKLKEKGINPHLLTMTATPIPRTVALTIYGELYLSYLDEMPKGRIQVKTWVVPPVKRNAAYTWIKNQIKTTGGQAFIICPLIEESETLKTVKAATKEYEYLKKEIFPDLRLGLIHGKVKSKEREEILNKFRSQRLDVLVATPVVEVGIDIPGATIMMIEGAERFGLAQLHQLRGRVGRGNLKSYCLLFSESENQRRLKAMEKIFIGAELAELDLRMRGPGEVYGTRQHGLPDLKVATLTDPELIAETRKSAEETLSSSPTLREFPLLKAKLESYTIKAVGSD